MTLAGAACAALALALAWPAHAADEEDLEDLLKREVVGPSRFAQSLADAPASVAVFGRADAQALGHQTVSELLARLPGVHLSQSRQYIGVGLRGMNRPGDYNARLLVAIDGVRVNDPVYDQALPDLEFPLVAEWVKRLELVYGPASSVYGANALLGVVNLVTLDGADSPGLSAKLSLGSFGTRRLLLQYGADWGAAGDLFIGLQALRSDGESLDLPELGLPGPVRGLDGVRHTATLLKYRRGPWRMAATAMQRDKSVPTAPYGTAPGVPGTAYVDRYAHVELGYEEGWESAWRRSLKLSAANSQFEGDYAYAGGLVNRDEARSLAYSLDARVQWRGWLNHDLAFGLDARVVPWAVQRNFDVDPPRDALNSRERSERWGVFVQDQWRLSSDWQLTAGLRVDHMKSLPAQWSPRLAMVWRPRPNEAFKFMLGRAYRAPNLAERFYEDGYSQLPNPALRPERLRSVELAWERALDARTVLSLMAYRTRLVHGIELTVDPVQGLGRYENVSSLNSQGIDLNLEQQSDGGWRWRVSLSAMQARKDRLRLSNSPSWLAKGHLIAPLAPGWSAALEWQGESRRLGPVTVPAQWSGNAVLRFERGPHALALRVRNLSDARLYDPAGPDNEALLRVPQPRRSLGLDWQWRL